MGKRLETEIMKLTKQTLKRIIKEELEKVIGEEQLDEGWKENMAMALGLAGAGVGVANSYEPSSFGGEPTHQVEYEDEGPRDFRNKFQKSSAELQHHQDAAESAAKQGNWDQVESHLRDYHGHMTRIEAEAKFMTGKDFSDIGANHGPEAVQKDLQQLKMRYGK